MEKSYRNIAYFFGVVATLVFIGFFRSYFGLFPNFEGIKTLLHYHAAVMISWLVLLIIQPVLIKQKKYTVHRYIGMFSYFLVPVIIFVMLLVYKGQYERLDSVISHEENLAVLFVPLTDVLPFTIFYILAIANQKNIGKHMRYMIATAIVVLSAGIFRIIIIAFGTNPDATFKIVGLVLIACFIGFIVFDKMKGKSVATNAFTTAAVIFAIPNLLLFVIPQTQAWQSFAETVVRIFS